MCASAATIDADAFLPTSIRVGAHTLGPADWMMAALEILSGAECAKLTPRPQMPSLDTLPSVKAARFRGGWVQSDTFEDRFLSDRLRLQAWTLRFFEEK